MGRRLRDKELANRMAAKTVESQFLHVVQEGLDCSPFEADAVLKVVKEVFLPFYEPAANKAPPGKISLMAVDAEEPAGKPISACEKRPVSLTVHRGPEDDALLRKEGPAGFRRARIPDLCQEALSQGGLLTAEDLAFRVFFVSTRTITRDLHALRQADPERVIPLRSTVHDIGPVLSHRTEVVRLALQGKTMSEICTQLHHSPSAVSNYLSTFTRCVQLARDGLHPSQIAFLLGRSESLLLTYLDLIRECEQNPNMAYHLQEIERLGRPHGEKKSPERSGRHG